jgi:5-methylcytosine-specific restriction endonuclease McrA
MDEEARAKQRTYSAKRRATHKEEIAAYNATYYAEHREEILIYKAAHKKEKAIYNAAHREGRRAYYFAHKKEVASYKATRREEKRRDDALYRAKHKEEIRARVAAYTAKHREEARARCAKYRAAHPEVVAEHNHRRRARKLRSPALAAYTTPDAIAGRREMWGGRCWVCGAEADATDHVKPLAKGGAHAPCNLRPICKLCNCKKKDKWPLTKGGL